MNAMLQKWLDHYDPIHLGYTPRGIAHGLSATCGRSFPRIGGGYTLYRGAPDEEPEAMSLAVGAAGPGASTLRSFPGYAHAAAGAWTYVVRSVGGGGVESRAAAPSIRVELDDLKNLVGPRPNSPSQLNVSPHAGGAFVLRWTYSAVEQATAPKEFRVYGDSGTGTVNLNSPVATILYRSGQVHYSYVTGPHAHEAERLWIVRAVSTEGVSDGNEAVVAGRAVAQPPPVHPMIVATQGEEC